MRIYEIVFTTYFVWSLFTITGTLLTLQIEKKIDLEAFVSVFIKRFYAFLMIYLYCECGEQISNRFDEVADSFYQMNWYSFPIKMQKMIPTILIAAQ